MSAYDYYRATMGATKSQVRAIRELVRAQLAGDTAILVAWNVWLCDALDVAETISPDAEVQS